MNGTSLHASEDPAEDVDLGSDDDVPLQSSAPKYEVPATHLSAVEVPAIIDNVDRAIQAFGRVPDLTHALDGTRNSIPIYLNPESPFCKPLMSHNARTHNVLLKVEVPKRTGRKRKRGSNGPWITDPAVRRDSKESPASSSSSVCSNARLDDPEILRIKLRDTQDKYRVEAAGIIKHTHRFRGFSDFYWDASRSDFAQRYVDQVLPGDFQKMKEFGYREGVDPGPQVDVLPPPMFTHMSLPFNYFYSQNPYVRTNQDGETVNVTAVKMVGHFVGGDEQTPSGPKEPPDMNDPQVVRAINEMHRLFQERPLWTRRSLLNAMKETLRNWVELKKYMNYAAYQFKGGPWRDSVVPYGVDPRTDPKYRHYQTVMFKLQRRQDGHTGQTWHAMRKEQEDLSKMSAGDNTQSHVFDGTTYHGDGKVWQVCDITDPLLRGLLDNAVPRSTCDPVSGWFHGGLWAKVKGIMKTKLVAIQFDRQVTDADFTRALQTRDDTPDREGAVTFTLPLPHLNLTEEELVQMRGKKPPSKRQRRKTGYSTKVRNFLREKQRLHDTGTQAGTPSAGGGEYDDPQLKQDEEEDVDMSSDEDDRGDGEDAEDDVEEEDEDHDV